VDRGLHFGFLFDPFLQDHKDKHLRRKNCLIRYDALLCILAQSKMTLDVVSVHLAEMLPKEESLVAVKLDLELFRGKLIYE
jgi:hypothetical protein